MRQRAPAGGDRGRTRRKTLVSPAAKFIHHPRFIPRRCGNSTARVCVFSHIFGFCKKIVNGAGAGTPEGRTIRAQTAFNRCFFLAPPLSPLLAFSSLLDLAPPSLSCHISRIHTLFLSLLFFVFRSINSFEESKPIA